MSGVRGTLGRAAVSTGGMVAQGIARFVYTLVIGRIAGPESLGQVSMLLSLAVYAALFWPAPAGQAASRFLPVTITAAQTVVILRRSFLLATAALTAVGVVAVAIISGGDLFLTLSSLILIPAYSGYVFTRGVLLGQDRIPRATLLDTITAILSITVLVGVLFAELHWALLLPLALSYLTFTLLSWPRGGDTRVSPAHRSLVLKYTRTTTFALIATGGLLPAAMLLVGIVEPPFIAGLFAAGISLATPASLVSQAVNQVLIPQFAAVQAAGGDPRSLHRRLFLITGVAFALVFGALIILTPWILSIFFGSTYASGALPMQLLLIGVFLMSLIAAPSAYLMSVGYEGVFARVWISSFVVGSIVMLVLAPTFGQWGVLAGYLLGTAMGTLTICVLGLIRAPRTAGMSPLEAAIEREGSETA